MSYSGQIFWDSLTYQYKVPSATTTQDGVMTKEQVEKLDSLPSGPVEAPDVGYTPATPSDWDLPIPSVVSSALDQLAMRVRILESVAVIPQIYTCPVNVVVRDLVYQSGAGAVDLADASDPSKMLAIGFVSAKLNPTTCVIQDEDELTGFAGLLPDVLYYADPSTPGGITPNVPDVINGEVAQPVCTPKDTTTIRIAISTQPPAFP